MIRERVTMKLSLEIEEHLDRDKISLIYRLDLRIYRLFTVVSLVAKLRFLKKVQYLLQ